MSPPRPGSAASGCDVAELDDEVLVTVADELDLSVLDGFRRCLDDAVRCGKPLFIDLTAVPFIDGHGYRAIRAAARALAADGRPAVTVATRSAVIAAAVHLTADPLIRVQVS